MKSLQDFMERVGDELRARLGKYDSFGEHKVEKGERRENAVAETIAQFLPCKFGVTSGEVVSSTNRLSKQIDILIYDAMNSPVLVDARDTKILLAESVYAAIAIKPNMDSKDELREALDNVRSVKELPRATIVPRHGDHAASPKGNPPAYGAIFTYGKHMNDRDVVAEMKSYCGGWPSHYWVDQICFFDTSVVWYRRTEGAHPGQMVKKICRPHDYPGEVPNPEIVQAGRNGKLALGLFLMEMLHHLLQMELFPPDLFEYAKITTPLVVKARSIAPPEE